MSAGTGRSAGSGDGDGCRGGGRWRRAGARPGIGPGGAAPRGAAERDRTAAVAAAVGGVPGAAAGPGFGSTERSVAAFRGARAEDRGCAPPLRSLGLRRRARCSPVCIPSAAARIPVRRRTPLAAGAPSPLEAPSVPSRSPSPRIRRRSGRRTAPGSPRDRGITEAGAAPRRGGLGADPTADARDRRGSLPAPGAAGGAGPGPEPALGGGSVPSARGEGEGLRPVGWVRWVSGTRVPQRTPQKFSNR